MGKQNHTPLLNDAEIGKLARDLNIPIAAVRCVLQAAGHELRERYRRRGWLPPKRDKKWRRSLEPLQRRATALAYREIKRSMENHTPHVTVGPPTGPMTRYWDGSRWMEIPRALP
jgi:hypothetical protein